MRPSPNRPTMRASGLILMLSLVACSGVATRAPELNESALAAYVQALACRISADCGDFPLRLIADAQVQAELQPDSTLELHLGLLLALADESELAFVLAHEIGHRELQHRPARSLAARLHLEVAADQHARSRLIELGFRADAGCSLLHRLRGFATHSAPSAGSAHFDGRLLALRCGEPNSEAGRTAIPSEFDAVLAPWRRLPAAPTPADQAIKDAPRDPEPRSNP